MHIIACAYTSSEIATDGTSHKRPAPPISEVPQPLFWMTVLEFSIFLTLL